MLDFRHDGQIASSARHLQIKLRLLDVTFDLRDALHRRLFCQPNLLEARIVPLDRLYLLIQLNKLLLGC